VVCYEQICFEQTLKNIRKYVVFIRNQSTRSVLFNLFVIMEPTMYFRVCHGTPLTKKMKHL